MSQQRLRELEEEQHQDAQEEQGLDLTAPLQEGPQSPSLHAASHSQQMQPSPLLAVAMAAQMQKQSPQKPAGAKVDAGASSGAGTAGDAGGVRAPKAASPAGGVSSVAVAGAGAGAGAPQGVSAAPSGLVVVSSTRVERKLSVAEEQSRASPHSTGAGGKGDGAGAVPEAASAPPPSPPLPSPSAGRGRLRVASARAAVSSKPSGGSVSVMRLARHSARSHSALPTCTIAPAGRGRCALGACVDVERAAGGAFAPATQ
jgi:hypothetical protein